MIAQGDVFWADLREPVGSAPGYPRPVVVIQNNVFNQSSISTVIACAITSNLERAWSPGNVQLAKGEANLTKRSVVNVSQVITIDRGMLKKRIGTLSKKRIEEIWEGLVLVLGPE